MLVLGFKSFLRFEGQFLWECCSKNIQFHLDHYARCIHCIATLTQELKVIKGPQGVQQEFLMGLEVVLGLMKALVADLESKR